MMMSVDRTTNSFYLTAVSPTLVEGINEFTIPLPTELVFEKHESWCVGLAGFARQQQQKQQDNRFKRAVVTGGGGGGGSRKQARNISMRFWIKEYVYTALDTAPSSFIASVKTWGGKTYSITVDTDAVVVTIPKGNYTFELLNETLSELFNDGCRRKNIYLRIEIEETTILIQRTASSSRPIHVIEFSDDLVSMFSIQHKKLSISSSMWSALIPHGAMGIPPLKAPVATDANGTFYLPSTQIYSLTVTEERTLPSSAPPPTSAEIVEPSITSSSVNIASSAEIVEPSITSSSSVNTTTSSYDICDGMWTFDAFAEYLRSKVESHGVSVTLSNNYVYQAGSLSIQNVVYYGGMTFKKHHDSGGSRPSGTTKTTVTITFNSALTKILGWTASNPFTLVEDGSQVVGYYNIALQKPHENEQELYITVNLNKDTDRDICQALNEAQRVKFSKHVPFYFDDYERRVTFSMPPRRHGYTLFSIRFDKTLTSLLGLNTSTLSTASSYNDSYLSHIFIKRPSTSAAALSDDEIGWKDNQLMLRNTVYWIYTDMINNDQITMMMMLPADSGTSMSDKFRLLRVLTYSENSENNAIYPVHYIPLDRRRISSINFKVSMNSINTSSVIMTLHFVRGV